jgi:hypothetical protein
VYLEEVRRAAWSGHEHPERQKRERERERERERREADLG